MENIIGDFIKDVYTNLRRKTDFMFPGIRNGFLAENNIALEMASVANDRGFYTYAECKMKDKTKRDLIIINPVDKWVCQAELKIIYFKKNGGVVLPDMERIYKLELLKEYLNNNIESKESFDGYKKYGLFTGYLTNNNYKMWLYKKIDEEEAKAPLYQVSDPEKAWNKFKDFFEKDSAKYGVIPDPYEQDRDKYWMAYYLVECGK